MPSDLVLVASAVFDVVVSIFELYFGIGLLTCVLALWFVRRVANLFGGLH